MSPYAASVAHAISTPYFSCSKCGSEFSTVLSIPSFLYIPVCLSYFYPSPATGIPLIS